jgi:RNA polymerase sigma-70 factor (ECF subfamily)
VTPVDLPDPPSQTVPPDLPDRPSPTDASDPTDAALARVVRAEAGLIVASLNRRIGDFDVAEEAVQEAIGTALRVWRSGGVPPNPGGWLAVTARRKAIDLLRARSRDRRLVETLGDEARIVAGPGEVPESGAMLAADDRLAMLFACCHPALAADVRVPLSLRAVVGMTTAQLARAFLVPEPTMAQRLVRAKRKIVAAGIPFAVPEDGRLADRLDDVLTAIAVAYDARYLDPASAAVAEDAIWLAELVARSLPEEPEGWGLLALLTFLSSRASARFDADGRLLVLAEQDRGRWDAVAIARADGYLTHAAAMRRPGRYQLQAAIAGCHASARTAAETDWLQILILYDMLLGLDPSPVVRLNRSIALAEVAGPETALAQVDGLADRLGGYHLFHATRAALLTRLGDDAGARVANERALALAGSSAERALLRTRLPG